MLCAVVCCGQGPAGYKADRDAQRKRDAGNRSAWSTLFMRADTVAAAVATHYGVSKSQLLDASAEDLPLRMALGEAQVGDAGGVLHTPLKLHHHYLENQDIANIRGYHPGTKC
jgi:hypothetical protein